MITKKILITLALFTSIFVLSCGGDEDGPENKVMDVCFNGDILETPGNNLDANTRIGILWNNNDDDGSLIFFLGEANIDLSNKTFSICIDSTMLPDKFTLGSEILPLEEDSKATIGYVLAFESDDFVEGTYTQDDFSATIAEVGWGTGNIIYKAPDYNPSLDITGVIDDFPLGFSIAGCDYDTGEIHDDLIYEGAEKLEVYIGSLEEIEAVYGNDPRCNFY